MTKKVLKDAKEVDAMPTIESLECERVAYVNGMKDYLQKLKALPSSEAIKRSRINLQNCNIIERNGEFTDQYRYSKINTINKE